MLVYGDSAVSDRPLSLHLEFLDIPCGHIFWRVSIALDVPLRAVSEPPLQLVGILIRGNGRVRAAGGEVEAGRLLAHK